MLQLQRWTVGLALAGAALTSQAAMFVQGHGFGEFGSGFGECYSASASGAFATGLAFDASSGSGGGCVGYFDVLIDTTAKTITLLGQETGNYEGGYLEITGITEEIIGSLTTISSDDLFDTTAFGGPPTFGGVPTPELSFTASSIRIQFSTFGETPQQFVYKEGGTAVFSYGTGTAPVSAPGSLLLVGAGLGLAWLTRRNGRALR